MSPVDVVHDSCGQNVQLHHNDVIEIGNKGNHISCFITFSLLVIISVYIVLLDTRYSVCMYMRVYYSEVKEH